MRYRPNSNPNIGARSRTANGERQKATGTATPVKNRNGRLLLTLMGWVLVVSTTVPWTVFTPLTEQNFQGAYGTNAGARIIKLALLTLSFAIVLRNFSTLLILLRQLNRFFMAFLFLAPLSVLWSISRDDTLARFVTILSAVLVWIAICIARWEPQRFQNVLRPITTFLILGSILFTIISPELAIEVGEGTLKDAWRGLMSQKNGFGQLASFGFIFWIHGWLARQVTPWRALLFGGCAAACVVFSRSSTSLIASIFVAIFLLMLLRAPTAWRRAMPYLIAAFAALVLTYALAILNLVPGLGILLRPITALTGKDMTFSDRSVIWDIIKEHIQFRPFLGSGYGAYWIGPVPTSESYTFLGRMYFYPNEAHNGYLEIVNDLGFIGLIVLLGYLILYLRQALRLLRFDRNQAALYLAIFFQQAIVNLSESCWLIVNSGLSFTIMTFATVALARSAVDQRAGAAPTTVALAARSSRTTAIRPVLPSPKHR
jgi:exopolysaccharide production protein ExoQ